MKVYLKFFFFGCFMVSCSSPSLMVQVEDRKQRPVSGFPLLVEFGEGIDSLKNGSAFLASGDGKESVHLGRKSCRLVTGSDGRASISYQFSHRQPNRLALLLGAPPLPQRSIELTPLRSLPKGSKVKLSIPNP